MRFQDRINQVDQWVLFCEVTHQTWPVKSQQLASNVLILLDPTKFYTEKIPYCMVMCIRLHVVNHYVRRHRSCCYLITETQLINRLSEKKKSKLSISWVSDNSLTLKMQTIFSMLLVPSHEVILLQSLDRVAATILRGNLIPRGRKANQTT